MRTLDVQIKNGAPDETYKIFFGDGLVGSFDSVIDRAWYSKTLFVYDSNVKSLWPELTPSGALETVMPTDGEKQKRVEILSSLWECFAQHGLDRRSLVVSVGGGALCDVVGFAASTYMRGIAFVNVPTTLLAMVDSSIGGKNGINIGGIKNLVGTFRQPQAVLVDPQLLRTLSKRELRAGYAELIKHGLISDKELFRATTQKPITELSEEALLDQIVRSCQIKGDIVSRDPLEQNVRKILNFGHTVGHALEALSYEGPKPLLHGEAVGIGMLIESKIGAHIGVGSETLVEQIRNILSLHGLPTEVPHVKVQDCLEKIQLDKKNRSGKILMALLSDIGRCEFDKEVAEEVIVAALQNS